MFYFLCIYYSFFVSATKYFQHWKLKYTITHSYLFARWNWKGTRDKHLTRSKDWQWWQVLALELSSITYCVCGYHVYCHVRDAALCEMLVCERKPTNEKYRYAFAVINFNVQLKRCRKYFMCLIFVTLSNHEILLTTKISGFMV